MNIKSRIKRWLFPIWGFLPFSIRDYFASVREKRRSKRDHYNLKKNKIIYISDRLSVKKTINYIDIGANKGDFLEEISRYYKMNKVVLVEPIPDTADYLKKKYLSPIYSVFQNVITDQENVPVDFFVNEFSETSSILEIKSEMEELSKTNTKLGSKEKVMSRTLDGIFFESKMLKIDLLKIDVQGVEHRVIIGGTKALKNTKLLLVEVSFKPTFKGSCVFSEVYDLLQERDFILLEISPGFRASNNDELMQVDALFLNTKFE